MTPLCGLLLFWFLFWAKHTGVGKYQDSKNRFLKIDLYKYIPLLLATLINHWFYLLALFRSILSHPTSFLLLSISIINQLKHLLPLIQLLFNYLFQINNFISNINFYYIIKWFYLPVHLQPVLSHPNSSLLLSICKIKQLKHLSRLKQLLLLLF